MVATAVAHLGRAFVSHVEGQMFEDLTYNFFAKCLAKK